jgi:hypothetical protein
MYMNELKMTIIVPFKLERQNALLLIFKHYQYIKHKLHESKFHIYTFRILGYFCCLFLYRKGSNYRFQKLSTIGLTDSDISNSFVT